MNDLTLLRSWGFAALLLGGVVGLMGVLAAPLAIPFLLGETWWSFALMGFVLLIVVSFIVGLGTWITHR